jgi:hypothetical protein
MWVELVQFVQPFLPLPLWVEHASLAFVIICASMLFRRSTVCRLAVSVGLLASGAMLLDLLPQPSLASALPAQFNASTLQNLMLGQRQFAEVALLSLGSVWMLDELRGLMGRRRAKVVARASARRG